MTDTTITLKRPPVISEEDDRILTEDTWSAISTLELAVAFHPDKPNKALKQTAKRILPRLHPYAQAAIADVVLNNLFPHGALLAFKTRITKAASNPSRSQRSRYEHQHHEV